MKIGGQRLHWREKKYIRITNEFTMPGLRGCSLVNPLYPPQFVPESHFHIGEITCLPQNAFSTRLSHLTFDMFPIFVNDIMHEVELGTWRSLFIHLLRILDCEGPMLASELDIR
jgi:hypothetical protein